MLNNTRVERLEKVCEIILYVKIEKVKKKKKNPYG